MPRAPRRRNRPPVKPPAAVARRSRWWLWATAAAAVYLVFQVYAPALHGPYLFDDFDLPYHAPNAPAALSYWIGGVRPFLLFSYWVNDQILKEPFGFHLTNVALHLINGFLVFFILRKLLELSGSQQANPGNDLLAAVGAALFLLHPIQTESVAYIAGRSECLSVLLFFAAFTAFLYRRRTAASWTTAAAVIVLFAAAVATKEHTVVLPALLLLTDYYWNPGFSWSGIRRNWRIYVPLAVGGIAGLIVVGRVLSHSRSAGFHASHFAWYEYLFTECRAFFVYLRLLVFPVGQNADWDFPASRNALDHGAAFYLAAILLLIGAAIYFRRRSALASYGFLVYVLLLLPTSSFTPIDDPVAERRLYLPIIGALLVALTVLRRVPVGRRELAVGCCTILAVLAAIAYQRNQLWGSDIALWEDTARKSPAKARAHDQLAFTYYIHGRCPEAAAQYAVAAGIRQPDAPELLNWGLACECAGQPAEALIRLGEAARLQPDAHVYSQIGLVYARQSRWPEALAALAKAESQDSGYAMTYCYRGGIRAATGDFAAAVFEYRRALSIDPANQTARQGLAYAQQQLDALR